jgi:glycosyltransferase involved in cell wall biosynthesis
VVYPSTDQTAPRVTQELRNGVQLHRFSAPRAAFFYNWMRRNQAALDCIRNIRRDDPGTILVSGHGYFANAVARSGPPTVTLFTGPWAEEFLQSKCLTKHLFFRRRIIAPMLRKVESIALKNSRSILTISEYYRRSLPVWHLEVSRPVHVIDGGVNTDQFRPAPDRAKLRAELGLREEETLFLAVRRLEPRMGLIDLIDGFQTVAQEFPKARLWIGGSGPLRDALVSRIRIFNLENRVRLLGYIPEVDLARYYGAADCTVMASTDLEGFGLSTIESLACGTPVIGTRRGATPEILEPLDPNLLYDSPSDLAPQLRAILSGAINLPSATLCREYVLSRYTWNVPVTAFERICQHLPGGSE